MKYFVIAGFVRGEGLRLSTAILLALGSLQETHLWDSPTETEEHLLAATVAECGTIQDRPRILEKVRRGILHRCSVSNEDGGRHVGQLL